MQLCPVCAGAARATAALDAEHIRQRLVEEFGASVPPAMPVADYEMRQCDACGLVFADPMRAGSLEFYQWVASFPAYHAEARWEWGVVRRILKQRARANLLELGCGQGKFLNAIADLRHVDAQGIDLSEAAIASARAKGLNARRASIEEFLGGQWRFDMIFMSHVLEHVEDPLGVVQNCKKLLDPGGEIIFSVPYSPTSREYLRLDIMNLPPHHLTRWNMASLRRLAEIARLKLAHEMREAKPLLKRALRHTVESVNGPGKSSALRTVGTVLSHPKVFSEAIKVFRSRERIDGRRAADEILVRLSL